MRRRILLLLLFAVLGAFACLPDLAALAPAVAVAPPGCGDRVIDPDAGETCDPGDAGGSGCTRCRVDCPDGGFVDPVSGHCYFVLTSSSSYNAAQEGCRNDGHLVTLTSDREATVVDEKVAKGTPYWLDLTEDEALKVYVPNTVSEPGFTTLTGDAGCPGCFVHGTLSGSGGCVFGGAGSWALTSCSAPSGSGFAVVCEREPAGQRTAYCEGPYCATVVSTIGAKRYLIYTAEVTADEAAATCASFPTGRLVVLDTEDEREQLVAELLRIDGVQAPLDVWIGLANVGGDWKWEDQAAVGDGTRPVPWGQGQPASSAPGDRAFLYIAKGASVDTHLARVDAAVTGAIDGGAPAAHAFICERAP